VQRLLSWARGRFACRYRHSRLLRVRRRCRCTTRERIMGWGCRFLLRIRRINIFVSFFKRERRKEEREASRGIVKKQKTKSQELTVWKCDVFEYIMLCELNGGAGFCGLLTCEVPRVLPGVPPPGGGGRGLPLKASKLTVVGRCRGETLFSSSLPPSACGAFSGVAGRELALGSIIGAGSEAARSRAGEPP